MRFAIRNYDRASVVLFDPQRTLVPSATGLRCFCFSSRRGLTVVSDDAQSHLFFSSNDRKEYSGFPDAILAASQHHHARPELRLTQTILAAANGVIEPAKERFTKTYGPTEFPVTSHDLSQCATKPTKLVALSSAFLKTVIPVRH